MRINLSLSDDTRQALARLARRERIPQATKAVRLLELALELEEDQFWTDLARTRDHRKARFLSHEATWQ